jgi:hypothetical protein
VIGKVILKLCGKLFGKFCGKFRDKSASGRQGLNRRGRVCVKAGDFVKKAAENKNC